MIPDCFNLDLPLAGFRPPVQEPPTPSSESGDSQLVNMTVSDFEPQSDAANRPHPHEQRLEAQPKSGDQLLETQPIVADQSEPNDQQHTPQEGHTPELSPKSGRRAVDFCPNPITLGRVWQSGSRNPISYATGLLNTATNLMDTHVHFVPRNRAQSAPEHGNEDRDEWESIEGEGECEGSMEEEVRRAR